MGKFGIEFSKPYVRPEIQAELDNLEKKNKESFQKGLTFSSYYTMVFVAICTFMPSKVAFAAESITNLTKLVH